MGRLPPLAAVCLAGILAGAPVAGWGASFKSVGASKVNLRSGPGTSYPRVYVVNGGYPVKVVDRDNNWLKVKDYEGDAAWVAERLLSDERTLLVIRDLVSVRKGPSTEEPVAFQAERHVLLQYLGRKGSWIHVRHADGAEGWVYAPLVWGD